MRMNNSPLNDSGLTLSVSAVTGKHDEGVARGRRGRFWRVTSSTHPQRSEERLRMTGSWEQNGGRDIDGIGPK